MGQISTRDRRTKTRFLFDQIRLTKEFFKFSLKIKNPKLRNSELSYASGPNSGYSKRGYFVIFNQESFYKKSGQILKRKGTDRDAAKIKKVMTGMLN